MRSIRSGDSKAIARKTLRRFPEGGPVHLSPKQQAALSSTVFTIWIDEPVRYGLVPHSKPAALADSKLLLWTWTAQPVSHARSAWALIWRRLARTAGLVLHYLRRLAHPAKQALPKSLQTGLPEWAKALFDSSPNSKRFDSLLSRELPRRGPPRLHRHI